MAVIIVAWLAIDQATKSAFDAAAVGSHLGSPIPGVIDFTLVHNTGGAWGMMGDMTIILGIVSLAVCAAAVVYVVAVPDQSTLAVVGLALVVAGGLGNVIDRFAHGYVIDFIEPAFIDFPVFNVADIGVTCGIALFVLSMVIEWRRASRRPDADAEGAVGAGRAAGTDDEDRS